MATRDITAREFNDTITNNGIVLVLFRESCCQSCSAHDREFAASSRRWPAIVHAVVDVEAEPLVAAAFELRATPKVMAFKQRHLVYRQGCGTDPDILTALVHKVSQLRTMPKHPMTAEDLGWSLRLSDHGGSGASAGPAIDAETAMNRLAELVSLTEIDTEIDQVSEFETVDVKLPEFEMLDSVALTLGTPSSPSSWPIYSDRTDRFEPIDTPIQLFGRTDAAIDTKAKIDTEINRAPDRAVTVEARQDAPPPKVAELEIGAPSAAQNTRQMGC